MQKLINYPHLSSMAFGQPHYATPLILNSVKNLLLPRILGDGQTVVMQSDDGSPDEPIVQLESKQESRYQIAGLAIIPVHGILVTRRGVIDSACTELTSYERIRSDIASALADERVKEIVLDLNSGGGMATGCNELADYIFANRDKKPITALVNFYAFSACYFIAAACSKVVISKTGGCGSIGVIMEHMEISKMESDVGIKFTTFFRGDRKKDGTQHEPLSDGATTTFNQMMDEAYDLFVSSVAKYRGMDVNAVIDTQAGLFRGQAAIDAGLADELSTPQDYLNQLASLVAKSSTQAMQSQQRIGIRARAMNITQML